MKTLLAAPLADVQCFVFSFYSGEKTLDDLHTSVNSVPSRI